MSTQIFNDASVFVLNEGFMDSLLINTKSTVSKTKIDYTTLIRELKSTQDRLKAAFSSSIFAPAKIGYNMSFIPNFFLIKSNSYETNTVYKMTSSINLKQLYSTVGLSETLCENELYNLIKEIDSLSPYFNVNIYYTGLLKTDAEVVASLDENYCLPSFYEVDNKKIKDTAFMQNLINSNMDKAISILKQHPLGMFIPFNKSTGFFNVEGRYNGIGKFISNTFDYGIFNALNTKVTQFDIFANLYYYLESEGFSDKYIRLGVYNISDNTAALYLRNKSYIEVVD